MSDADVVPLSDGSIPAVVKGQHRLYQVIEKAVGTLEDLMSDPEQEGYVRLNAANSALDRVGLGKKSTVDHKHEVTHGVDAQVEELIERLRRKANPPEIAAPIHVAPEVVGEDDVEEAEIVEDPEPVPQPSVVLDFNEFLSRPPGEL